MTEERPTPKGDFFSSIEAALDRRDGLDQELQGMEGSDFLYGPISTALENAQVHVTNLYFSDEDPAAVSVRDAVVEHSAAHERVQSLHAEGLLDDDQAIDARQQVDDALAEREAGPILDIAARVMRMSVQVAPVDEGGEAGDGTDIDTNTATRAADETAAASSGSQGAEGDDDAASAGNEGNGDDHHEGVGTPEVDVASKFTILNLNIVPDPYDVRDVRVDDGPLISLASSRKAAEKRSAVLRAMATLFNASDPAQKVKIKGREVWEEAFPGIKYDTSTMFNLRKWTDVHLVDDTGGRVIRLEGEKRNAYFTTDVTERPSDEVDTTGTGTGTGDSDGSGEGLDNGDGEGTGTGDGSKGGSGANDGDGPDDGSGSGEGGGSGEGNGEGDDAGSGAGKGSGEDDDKGTGEDDVDDDETERVSYDVLVGPDGRATSINGVPLDFLDDDERAYLKILHANGANNPDHQVGVRTLAAKVEQMAQGVVTEVALSGHTEIFTSLRKKLASHGFGDHILTDSKGGNTTYRADVTSVDDVDGGEGSEGFLAQREAQREEAAMFATNLLGAIRAIEQGSPAVRVSGEERAGVRRRALHSSLIEQFKEKAGVTVPLDDIQLAVDRLLEAKQLHEFSGKGSIRVTTVVPEAATEDASESATAIDGDNDGRANNLTDKPGSGNEDDDVERYIQDNEWPVVNTILTELGMSTGLQVSKGIKLGSIEVAGLDAEEAKSQANIVAHKLNAAGITEVYTPRNADRLIRFVDAPTRKAVAANKAEVLGLMAEMESSTDTDRIKDRLEELKPLFPAKHRRRGSNRRS